mgnify:CR=1 FL=1
MDDLVPIMIPEGLHEELGNAAREEGVSRDTFAAEALEKYLFIKKFRALREQLISESARSYTDEEVFELVS